MTCIAFDGRFVASDMLCKFGGYRGPLPVVKIREHNGIVYGLTGYPAWFDAWIDWHQKGADPNNTPKCTFAGDNTGNFLVFQEGKAFVCYYQLPYLQEAGAPDAWGSGAEFAIGAMKAGASARQAVEITIECNPDCGGPVQVIDLQSLKAKAA
jgi:hypothetical protein